MVNNDKTKSSLDKIEDRLGNLENILAKERTSKRRLFIIGTSLLVLGVLILGTGIYFRQAYTPSNFNFITFITYRLEYRQAYAAGLSGIVVGSLMAVGGIVIMIIKRNK